MKKILFITMIVLLSCICLAAEYDDQFIEESFKKAFLDYVNGPESAALTAAEVDILLNAYEISTQDSLDSYDTTNPEEIAIIEQASSIDYIDPDLFVSAEGDAGDGLSFIDSCQTLDQPNTEYKLTRDLVGVDVYKSGEYGCFDIKANDIILNCQGHSITSDGEFSAVYASGYDRITVKDCIINMGTSGYGISIYHSDSILISGNTLNEQYFGLSLGNIGNSIIENNIAKDNWEHGFSLGYEMHNTIIRDNEVSSNRRNGIVLTGGTGNQIINNLARSNGEFGISLEGSADNNEIRQNTANSNYFAGIATMANNNNIISENNLDSNNLGIYVSQASDNTIENNNIRNGEGGIGIYHNSHNNIFRDNVIEYHYNIGNGLGIYVLNSDSNSFTGNSVKSNDNGILFESANSNEFNDNSVCDNNFNTAAYAFKCIESNSNYGTGNKITGEVYRCDDMWPTLGASYQECDELCIDNNGKKGIYEQDICWYLGEDGQSCDEVCSNLGSGDYECDEYAYFRGGSCELCQRLMRFPVNDDNEDYCAPWPLGGDSALPYYGGDKTVYKCYWRTRSGTLGVNCEAPANTYSYQDHQRVCPCVVPREQENLCGNGICDEGEDYTTCLLDCVQDCVYDIETFKDVCVGGRWCNELTNKCDYFKIGEIYSSDAFVNAFNLEKNNVFWAEGFYDLTFGYGNNHVRNQEIYFCNLTKDGSPGGCLENDEKTLIKSVDSDNFLGILDVYDTNLLFVDKEGTYLYNLSDDSILTLSTSSNLAFSYSMYNNLLVWAEQGYSDSYIYFCNLSKNGHPEGCLENDVKTVVAYASNVNEAVVHPYIFGEIIVWDKGDGASYNRLQRCNLTKNGHYGGCLRNDEKVNIENPNLPPFRFWYTFPKVYGDYIAWPDIPYMNDIRLCNLTKNDQDGGCLAGDTKTLISAEAQNYFFDIYETKLIWNSGSGSSPGSIYGCNLNKNGNVGGCEPTDEKTRIRDYSNFGVLGANLHKIYRNHVLVPDSVFDAENHKYYELYLYINLLLEDINPQE